MEKIAIVEIDLDRCSNTYSIAPCTASLSANEPDKCFNCYATCQDKPNYNTETVTARYSTASAHIPSSFDTIPNIESFSMRPSKLELGESIGIRASVNITFKDSRFPDTGPEGDRYLSDRSYDPYTRGSYWGKFRARWPFIQGSDIRLIMGDNTQSIAQMETRHFIVERVAGPDSSGTFTIQCKDALQLADGKKSQAPLISKGAISAAISSGTTAITLVPAGIGNAEYPASGTAQIGGEEVVTFTRSGDSMTISRGKENTTATDHDEDSRVQLCLVYNGNTVTEIINDLLVNYANVPPSFIPFSDWDTEDDTYIGRNYTAVIAEPEQVKTLINELLEQTASTIWWDEISKLIRFRVLRAVDSNAAFYDDNIVMGGTFSAKDQPDKRVSQVWTYYGQLSPLEKLNETKNYAATQATINPESEASFNGVPSIKKIFSRWIPSVALDAAEKLNELVLARYSTPPRLVAFTLQRDTFNIAPELGAGYNIQSHTIQDFTGALATLPIQAIQVKAGEATYSVLGEEVLYSSTVAPTDPTVKQVTIQENANNIVLRDYFDIAWSTINPGDTVNISIEDGVTISSSSVALKSILFGDWPSGITINLINNGSVIGKGGVGGDGGRIVNITTLQDGVSGGTGGDAIDASQPNNPTINIINNGLIGGGGGGGGGGGSAYGLIDADIGGVGYAVISGSGGGGSASLGLGGVGGTVSAPADGGNISYLKRVGLSGSSASGTVSGNGGDALLLQGFQQTVTAGSGGDGGTIGNAGLSGSSGVISGGVEGNVTSSGGSGGAAGDAINKSGKTVTITNNGTIAGAIVP